MRAVIAQSGQGNPVRWTPSTSILRSPSVRGCGKQVGVAYQVVKLAHPVRRLRARVGWVSSAYQSRRSELRDCNVVWMPVSTIQVESAHHLRAHQAHQVDDPGNGISRLLPGPRRHRCNPGRKPGKYPAPAPRQAAPRYGCAPSPAFPGLRPRDRSSRARRTWRRPGRSPRLPRHNEQTVVPIPIDFIIRMSQHSHQFHCLGHISHTCE